MSQTLLLSPNTVKEITDKLKALLINKKFIYIKYSQKGNTLQPIKIQRNAKLDQNRSKNRPTIYMLSDNWKSFLWIHFTDNTVTTSSNQTANFIFEQGQVRISTETIVHSFTILPEADV